MTVKDKGPLGDALEEFLSEIDIANEVYGTAVKRVVTWQSGEVPKPAAVKARDSGDHEE